MKTNTILKSLALPAAVALALCTTACDNADDFVSESQSEYTRHEIPVMVNASRIGGDEAMTRASYNSTTKKLEFSTGDQLFIQGTHASAGAFAGTLSFAGSGKFSGSATTTNDYAGTSEELLSEATSVTATLLPNDYATYGYFTITGEGAARTLEIKTNKALAATKALAIEQFSHETATAYSSGFALTPSNAVVNFTINGLENSHDYKAFVSDGKTIVGGAATSAGSGTLTFAIAIEPGGSKTYAYNISGYTDESLGTKTLTAGQVYNVTKSGLTAFNTEAQTGPYIFKEAIVVFLDGDPYAVTSRPIVSDPDNPTTSYAANPGYFKWDDIAGIDEREEELGTDWHVTSSYELNGIIHLSGMAWNAETEGYKWHDLELPAIGHIYGGFGGGLKTEEIGHWGYYWTSSYERNNIDECLAFKFYEDRTDYGSGYGTGWSNHKDGCGIIMLCKLP